MSKVVIEVLKDGTIKIDSSKMAGSEAQIKAVLEELAAATGGKLEIEKHVGNHTHTATEKSTVKN